MHAEDLLIDDSGNGEAVETVSKRLPELNVITTLTLVVETIYTVDRGTLVVASE